VLKDKENSIQVNVDDLEKFVEDREYLDIPNVFPDDYGKIPEPPQIYKYFLDLLTHEI
jgi:hypothetical protein